MPSEYTLLVLAVVFSALALFMPWLKGLQTHWLRFLWYRVVVALREDRSYTRLDLPTWVKTALLLVLHPLRTWHGRTTDHEWTIQQFVSCPCYQPKRCVSPNLGGLGRDVGCDPTGNCDILGRPDQIAEDRQRSLIQLLRSRPPDGRAIKIQRYHPRPCTNCDQTPAIFIMGGGKLLCDQCFGIPHEYRDLLPKPGR